MTLHHTRFYWIECDECGEPSEEYQYGKRESEEFKGRGTIYARRMASRDGWTTFSERDLCPEHSGKAKPMTKVTCRYGDHRVPKEDARTASRFGGGDYRRPGRWYRSTICVDCARTLLSRSSDGHSTVSQWRVSDLGRAVGQTSNATTPNNTPDVR